MKTALILTSLLFVAACAGTMQTASISEAYKKYDDQEYKRTLELIARAENSKAMTPETKAELTFLKAKTYEGLGETDQAVTLYTYLKEQHEDSQYSYLADKQLEVLQKNNYSP